MEYKMNVRIKDPKTAEGMTSGLSFNLTCYFVYDEEQYGNGHYLVIEGQGFSSQHFDLRYDTSFNRNKKEEWLEKWARNYWSGTNGAWTIESLEIVKIAK